MGFPTARVADSYGADPHEHKPSQDVWDADTAEEKQAGSGGVNGEENGGGDGVSPGPNSSTSPSETESTDVKTDGDSTPAPMTENPSEKAPTGSSTADSTATARKAASSKAGRH